MSDYGRRGLVYVRVGETVRNTLKGDRMDKRGGKILKRRASGG